MIATMSGSIWIKVIRQAMTAPTLTSTLDREAPDTNAHVNHEQGLAVKVREFGAAAALAVRAHTSSGAC